jgi:hypothetical protein
VVVGLSRTLMMDNEIYTALAEPVWVHHFVQDLGKSRQHWCTPGNHPARVSLLPTGARGIFSLHIRYLELTQLELNNHATKMLR